MGETLDLPPFPLLEWDGYVWTAPVVLPAWAGFQARRERGLPRGFTPPPSDGSANMNVMTPDGVQARPSLEQAAAYQYLVDHQHETQDAILQAVLDDYDGELMPDLERPEQLTAWIGLSGVNLFPTAKDGIAYVGYEFRCLWEEEHGLGAMTQAGHIVGVGGADMAILEWIAARDAKKAAREPEESAPPGASGSG